MMPTILLIGVIAIPSGQAVEQVLDIRPTVISTVQQETRVEAGSCLPTTVGAVPV
jgi:hypothetical protein